MLNRFHVDPKTGKVGFCYEEKGTCKFEQISGEENHYDTPEKELNASSKILISRDFSPFVGVHWEKWSG